MYAGKLIKICHLSESENDSEGQIPSRTAFSYINPAHVVAVQGIPVSDDLGDSGPFWATSISFTDGSEIQVLCSDPERVIFELGYSTGKSDMALFQPMGEKGLQLVEVDSSL